MMFKVLRVDGPNLMTDKGGICIAAFQYADGGKTKPVSLDDWEKMRDLFIASPKLLASCMEMLMVLGAQEPNATKSQVMLRAQEAINATVRK